MLSTFGQGEGVGGTPKTLSNQDKFITTGFLM